MSRLSSLVLTSGLVFLAGAPAPGFARQLQLEKQPLFLASSVQPNVLFTLDDSGSMKSAYMPETITGGVRLNPYWDNITTDPSLPNPYRVCGFQTPQFFSSSFNYIYYNPSVTYRPPINYDGTRLPNADFNAAWVDGYRAFLGTEGDADQVVNLATDYFPTFDLTYAPPPGGAMTHRRIMYQALPPPTDTSGGSAAYMGTPADPTLISRCDDNNPPQGKLIDGDLTTSFLPFVTLVGGVATESRPFWYEHQGDNSADWTQYHPVELDQNDDAAKQNFANWYSYYRTRTLLARASIAEAFVEMGPSIRTVWQGINANPIDAASEAKTFDPVQKEAFFRYLFQLRPSSDTPLRAATTRAGQFFQRNSGDARDPYFDVVRNMPLTCRANFHVMVTDGYWNERNPATDVTGEGVHQTLAGFPIGAASPGGFAYSSGDIESRVYWNKLVGTTTAFGHQEDCRAATGTAKISCDPSLADLAFHYWATDLRDDLDDRVPRRWDDLRYNVLDGSPDTFDTLASQALALTNKEVWFNPKNDPANWQHMVNYTIGLGLAGTLNLHPITLERLRGIPRAKVNSDGVVIGPVGVDTWPYPKNAASRGSDDAWHAAVVSRGEYMMANDSRQLYEHLRRTMLAIEAQSTSASAATLTSGVASDASFAIRTSFDTGDWSGDVESFSAGTDGIGQDPHWSAAAELDGDPPSVAARDPADRKIFTSDGPNGGGVPFLWGSLGSAWTTKLNDNPATAALDNDGLGERRLNYLRGARTDESSNGGPFRARLSVLGAAVQSSAVVVGNPSAAFQDEKFETGSPEAVAAAAGHGYAQFRATTDRDRVAYVATNDGMLHAFDAGRGSNPGTGAELWAYVPHEPAIGKLTMVSPGLEPMVDSTPSVRDMFVNGQWRTMLVGSLRLGGQGVYALDITDPTLEQSSTDAQRLVMWEFSDNLASPGNPEPSRLGYTYGKPNLVRLESGRWVVLLPGGYNNEQNDGIAGDGSASLFVLSADDGTLLREINIPGTFGIGFATTGDLDDDGSDEFALAGDLNGNLWHFDLSQSSPSAWSARKVYQASAFTYDPAQPARQEPNPISSAPRIFGDPATGGIIAIFGTGKLLVSADNLPPQPDTEAQRVIAVRINPFDSATIAPVQLNDLVQRHITTVTEGEARYYHIDSGPLPANEKGWYFDLPEPGERIINAPGALFSHGLVLINSVIPNGGDPCEGGLRGNFYVIDALTGSAPQQEGLFDTNSDGVVNADDDTQAIGVHLIRSVAEGTPSIIATPGGGDAHVADFPSVKIPDPVWRRRSWRELR